MSPHKTDHRLHPDLGHDRWHEADDLWYSRYAGRSCRTGVIGYSSRMEDVDDDALCELSDQSRPHE